MGFKLFKDSLNDSESAVESASPGSEGPAPQAYEEDIHMDESQTIAEEELTSTKQERPKSEEIISKVEELSQQMAPAPQEPKDLLPAPTQEPTEDEEGTKTPPPSPVEGEFVPEEARAQQAAVDELAARLSTTEEPQEHPGETVFESELIEEEESTKEQVLPDGSKVIRKRFKSGDSIKGENGEQESMELVEEEGPEVEDVKYEEDEEVLEDGTVHRISRTRRQSLKHIKRTLISESGEEEEIFEGDVAVPGKAKEDVIEVFEEPAKPITQVEEVEVTQDDGKVVKKRMIMNRMVSNVKTFHQSFDDCGNLEEDEYEVEAIIPGTETAFVEGDDTTTSSSESSEDDDNDEEIDVQDLDIAEEECQSGTTITTRQVTKQTFTSSTYETDGEPKELEETGLVKRAVKKVTYDPGQPDLICDSPEYDDEEDFTDGAEGGEMETHRLTMKKEIHTRTMLEDGKEKTYVHEEAQIEQEEDPPEELKESMQQIIDQFMETPAQPDQYKALEHDV